MSSMAGTRAGFIAIVGRPNSGKSTLVNRILDSELSIVTPKAQTTREKVLGILTRDSNQMIFVDTPGIHRARAGGINEYMVKQATAALEDTCQVWYLIDPASQLEHEADVIEVLKDVKVPICVIANKNDLKRVEGSTLFEGVAQRLRSQGQVVHSIKSISAKTGKGIQELIDAGFAGLPESPFYYADIEQLSDRPVRFFVAEKIREQLYLCLGEELPYSCVVEIEKFDETGVIPRIEAVIYVERESQKGMVIGKGGAKIKEIGSRARETTEHFLDKKVFLGLKVKVLTDWTTDGEAMKRLGFGK